MYKNAGNFFTQWPSPYYFLAFFLLFVHPLPIISRLFSPGSRLSPDYFPPAPDYLPTIFPPAPDYLPTIAPLASDFLEYNILGRIAKIVGRRPGGNTKIVGRRPGDPLKNLRQLPVQNYS